MRRVFSNRINILSSRRSGRRSRSAKKERSRIPISSRKSAEHMQVLALFFEDQILLLWKCKQFAPLKVGRMLNGKGKEVFLMLIHLSVNFALVFSAIIALLETAGRNRASNSIKKVEMPYASLNAFPSISSFLSIPWFWDTYHSTMISKSIFSFLTVLVMATYASAGEPLDFAALGCP